MKKLTITTLFFLLIFLEINAQTVITDLYGFRLGQYRETATNEFGKPFEQDTFEDGFKYEAFLLQPDTSSYMIFEYSKDQPDIIWSIQISGYYSTMDVGFKGLKLGLDKKQVEAVLGKPDDKEDIGTYGETWNYEKTNYSIEISKAGKLSSVKIRNTYSGEQVDASKLPKFANVIQLMSSKNNADIGSIVAPGIEIYYKGQTLFFGKSFKTELEKDESKIFQTIRELSKGLTSDLKSIEENLRILVGETPKHVIKIKKGHAIKEIVFEYINGKFLIWEIDAQ